jgi:hypothetical protein
MMSEMRLLSEMRKKKTRKRRRKMRMPCRDDQE